MRKLISVLGAILLCAAAHPWLASAPAAAAVPDRPAAPSSSSSSAAAPASPVAASPVPAEPAMAPVAARLGDRIDLRTASSSGVGESVLDLALTAINCAVTSGDIAPPRTLTLIDYSRPSLEPRLWVFDLTSGEMLFREHVAHGANTGDNMATRFSDAMNSHQTSLGLFVTANTYVGRNGYSLRLDGLEPGFNGRARDRAIVMHGAPYVDASAGAAQGRLGRSWGCPALREAVARDVIDTISGGGVIFSYYPDDDWLTKSRFLNCQQPERRLAGLWRERRGRRERIYTEERRHGDERRQLPDSCSPFLPPCLRSSV